LPDVLGEVAQLALNGMMAGTILAVPAIGFTAIYAVLRFPNFTVASHLTIGAFAGWVANTALGLPAAAAVAVAFVVAGVAGVLNDELLLKPLRPAGGLTTAIGAVALTIVLENAVRFVFGNDLRGYALPIQRDWQFAGVRVGPQQVQNFALAVAAMTGVFVFLAFTRMGKAMRAVADNPTLASIKGIDADRVARLTNFVAMGLAGVGGMLVGLDTSIDPLTGFRVILSVFAAAVVGGLGSIPGAVVGALTIGVGEELSLLVWAPAYRSVVGFAAILLVLTLRPRGLLGERAY
jgi:branched-chain amino acid transport system permease protein/neutral amino acid transport system permease protein